MPSQVKIEKVQELTDKIGRAKAVVLTDYRGLSVKQLEELRAKIEEQGAEFEITKNSLLSRSLGDKQAPADALEGPTATLIAFQDEVAPLKALHDFIKTHELPKVKVGFLGNELLDMVRVAQLASLPSREALLGKLVGSLQAGPYGLVNVLTGNLRKLVFVLDAIAKSNREVVS